MKLYFYICLFFITYTLANPVNIDEKLKDDDIAKNLTFALNTTEPSITTTLIPTNASLTPSTIKKNSNSSTDDNFEIIFIDSFDEYKNDDKILIKFIKFLLNDFFRF